MWTTVEQVRLRGSLGANVSDDLIRATIDEAYTLIVGWGHDSGLSGTQLAVAERYLALHLLESSGQRVASESIAGASVSYAVPGGTGLAATAWGQLYSETVKTSGGIPIIV